MKRPYKTLPVGYEWPRPELCLYPPMQRPFAFQGGNILLRHESAALDEVNGSVDQVLGQHFYARTY